MRKIDILKMASSNLWRRKVRTFLTVLGVLIGTTSIVVMLSLGIGLDEANRTQMERWGSLNVIQISQGMRWDDEGNPIGDGKALDEEAVKEIRTMEGVISVTPGFEIGGMAKWGKKDGHLQIIGLEPAEMANFEFDLEKGRLLDREDRFNIVVGSEVGYNFRDEREIEMLRKSSRQGNMMERDENKTLEMLDQRVTLELNNYNNKTKRFNFTVVGVLSDKYRDKSWQAYAPISEIKRMKDFIEAGNKRTSTRDSFEPQNKKKNKGTTYDFVWVKTDNVEDTKRISQDLKDEGYNSYSMADYLEGIEQGSRIIQGVLGGIGSITLLVAALGIINTMIMSIYERTREIGIMKVIGASFFDIRFLFLTEAGLIGLTGGVLGLGLSYGLSKIINHLSADFINQGMAEGQEVALSVVPLWLVLFALGFSLLIGVVAGLYPANKAVKLSPINAIRNE